MDIWLVPKGINLKESFQLRKLKHTEYNLSHEQQALLRKRGFKYYQLMDGSIRPTNAKQKHFVDMCKSLVEPANKWERIWKSYWATIEEEERLDEVYRSELGRSAKAQERLKSQWRGNPVRASTESENAVNLALSDEHSRECLSCRGSGMKADGDNCERCNGRGWRQSKISQN